MDVPWLCTWCAQICGKSKKVLDAFLFHRSSIFIALYRVYLFRISSFSLPHAHRSSIFFLVLVWDQRHEWHSRHSIPKREKRRKTNMKFTCVTWNPKGNRQCIDIERKLGNNRFGFGKTEPMLFFHHFLEFPNWTSRTLNNVKMRFMLVSWLTGVLDVLSMVSLLLFSPSICYLVQISDIRQ